jgi:hypothetical protein
MMEVEVEVGVVVEWEDERRGMWPGYLWQQVEVSSGGHACV